jgi:hypothetical protein
VTARSQRKNQGGGALARLVRTMLLRHRWVQFVAHDSRLRFESLNHATGDTINPQRPIAADDNALILLPL